MFKDFHFKVYSSLLNAAYINNTTTTDEKISMLDCNILSLIRSFHDSKKQCYMTNEQLAKTFLVTERTIQSSLSRLYWRGFIKSEQIKHDGVNKRVLFYQENAVKNFIAKMTVA